MLAFATDYYGESKNTGEIRNTLERIARAGFTHVHWGHEWCGDYTYSIYEILQIKTWLTELGLKVKGIHATDGVFNPPKDPAVKQNNRSYTSPIEFNRLAGVEIIQNRVDMAYELNAESIVLHLHLPYKDFEKDPAFRDQFYTQACKSLDELEPYCRTRQIRICIENLPDSPMKHQSYQFEILFRRYSPDYLGFCFDTGHANIICPDSLEFARLYKDRLFMVHIHDNHGQTDEHLLPFEGTFNWEGFAEVFASSAYEKPYLLETQLKGEEDHTRYLESAYKAGEKFSAMVQQASSRIS
jgi:sugar phosphate isomerase/epimerase